MTTIGTATVKITADTSALHPVDGLPMCGQPVDGGYCARAPHGAEVRHIQEDGHRIARHRFVESGPGQAPTTIQGCIVCPDCYLPKGHAVHLCGRPVDGGTCDRQIHADWCCGILRRPITA